MSKRPDYSRLEAEVQPYARALVVKRSLERLSKGVAEAKTALSLINDRMGNTPGWHAPLFVPTQPWVATADGKAVVIPEPLWEQVLEMVAAYETTHRPPTPDGHTDMATALQCKKDAITYIDSMINAGLTTDVLDELCHDGDEA